MIYDDRIIDDIVTYFFDSNVIKKSDEVIVGLSGGIDSMCLFDAMYKLHDEFSFCIKAVHVHHGIRGIEADSDLSFVRRYCKNFDIDLITSNVDAVEYAKKNKLSLEEAARILRYNEFDKIWKQEQKENSKHNVYIAVAHHLKDQAETIIHNMIRGTGIKGIAGMSQISGYIIRPLLYEDKSEIEKYIHKYDIPFVNDSTNNDTTYTRNFIRKELIDKMTTINANALSHINEIALKAKEINDYLEMLAKKLVEDITIENTSERVVLNLKLFRNTSNVIKSYMVRNVFDRLTKTLKDITKVNVDDIIALTEKEKGGHLDLPYNIVVNKKQNNLIFEKKNINESMSRRKKK